MRNSKIDLSIIIPTFNSSKTILKTLKSVFFQDYKKYEIIIIDSHSSDNTVLKIKSLRNKKIKLFYTDKKKGLAYARYFGILKSHGKYIAFLDSDDEWKKGKLKKQLQFMKNKRSFFSCTNFHLKKNNYIKKILINKNKIFFNDLLIDRPIALSSVIVLKKILIDVAGKYNSNNYAEDYLWWIMILKKKYHCDVLKIDLTRINVVENSRSVKVFLNYIALVKIYKVILKLSFIRIFLIFMLLIFNTFEKNIFKYKNLFLNK